MEIIKIKVKPASKKQEIKKQGDSYLVWLKSKPENNKANLELLNLLKKHFNRQVRIIKGIKSRKKFVELE